MTPSTENTVVAKAYQGPNGERCHKTGTHNCWPPRATSHVPKPRGGKKTKKVGAMMVRWIGEIADEAPWTALGYHNNAGFLPETATNEEKEGQ